MGARKKLILIFSAALLAVTACSNVPAHVVQDHPVPAVAQKLSIQEIEQAIIQAGTARQWRFEPIAPGQIRAQQSNGTHEAVVDIRYSQTSYSIQPNSTKNLREKNGTVHPRYNLWLRNLEKGIDDQLYAAGMARR
jgi:hypothetical protein